MDSCSYWGFGKILSWDVLVFASRFWKSLYARKKMDASSLEKWKEQVRSWRQSNRFTERFFAIFFSIKLAFLSSFFESVTMALLVFACLYTGHEFFKLSHLWALVAGLGVVAGYFKSHTLSHAVWEGHTPRLLYVHMGYAAISSLVLVMPYLFWWF